MTFPERLRHAAEAGILIAVKYGAAVAIIGGLIWLAAGDYLAVRRAAQEGCGAFTFLAASIQRTPGATPPVLQRCE